MTADAFESLDAEIAAAMSTTSDELRARVDSGMKIREAERRAMYRARCEALRLSRLKARETEAPATRDLRNALRAVAALREAKAQSLFRASTTVEAREEKERINAALRNALRAVDTLRAEKREARNERKAREGKALCDAIRAACDLTVPTPPTTNNQQPTISNQQIPQHPT